jgi:hypothetical protein
MGANLVYDGSMFLMSSPILFALLVFVHFLVRRAAWKHGKRQGRTNLGYYPSTSALGTAFQYMQIFHRPSMAYVIEAKQEQDADEDENGDPESIQKQLNRQLWRIRRGDPIDRLVLRL